MTAPLTRAPRVAARPAAAHPDVEAAVRRLIEFVGEDPARDGLADTPARVAKALLELTQGYAEDPATILGRVFDEPTEGLVIVRDIPFSSLCEHHMLPFTGRASVAYLPGDKVVGLSKIPRLIDCFARRLQMQERLTREVAEAIDAHLAPRGVAVLVEGEHACMRMRGAKSQGSMLTTCFLGDMRDETRRREFLDLVRTG